MTEWYFAVLILLLAGCMGSTGEWESSGKIHIPYLYGDTGMVAIQAGALLPVTWEDAPLDAVLYLFLWIPYDAPHLPTLIGIDPTSDDGVAIQWKVPEYIGGRPRAIALYADGSRILNVETSLTYGSGKAPPEGSCTIGYSSLSGSPEVFAQNTGSGRLGYLSDYTPVLERVVDSDGLPWLKVDLSDESVIAPADDAPAEMPETGWVYAVNIRFYGDCSHLE